MYPGYVLYEHMYTYIVRYILGDNDRYQIVFASSPMKFTAQRLKKKFVKHIMRVKN